MRTNDDRVTKIEEWVRSLGLSAQDLLSANAETHAASHGSPDVCFRLDEAGRILEVKVATEADLSRPPSQLLGKRIQDFPDRRAGKKFDEAIGLLHGTKSPVDVEYALRLTRGRTHFVARLWPLGENQILVVVRETAEV